MTQQVKGNEYLGCHSYINGVLWLYMYRYAKLRAIEKAQFFKLNTTGAKSQSNIYLDSRA